MRKYRKHFIARAKTYRNALIITEGDQKLTLRCPSRDKRDLLTVSLSDVLISDIARIKEIMMGLGINYSHSFRSRDSGPESSETIHLVPKRTKVEEEKTFSYPAKFDKLWSVDIYGGSLYLLKYAYGQRVVALKVNSVLDAHKLWQSIKDIPLSPSIHKKYVRVMYKLGLDLESNYSKGVIKEVVGANAVPVNIKDLRNYMCDNNIDGLCCRKSNGDVCGCAKNNLSPYRCYTPKCKLATLEWTSKLVSLDKQISVEV